MNNCPRCQSNSLTQTSLLLTRILICFYIFMVFYLFTGSIMIQSVISIVPLIIPYRNTCSNCNAVFYRVMKFKRVKGFSDRNNIDIFILYTFPYFMIIVILIILFPYTGLGRIIYLPMVFLFNSLIIAMSLFLQYALNTELQHKIKNIVIFFTSLVALVFYPQDSREWIWELLF